MTPTRTLTAVIADTFVAPGNALAAIRVDRRSAWVPLLAVVAATLLFWVWYYTSVDIAWLRDQALSQVPADNAAQAGRFITRGFLLATSAIGAVLVTLVVYALQAGYLTLVARLLDAREIGFGEWFSLTAWTRLPALLAILAMMISYAFTSSHQVDAGTLNVVSFNTLLVHLHYGDRGFSLAQSVTLTLIWSLGLLSYGVMRWLNRSALAATAIVFTPYLLIYGIWLAIVLR